MSALPMVSSMTSMQAPTDFPSAIASASFARAPSWRRRIRTVFSTDHLTWESVFFCVKPKLRNNESSCFDTQTHSVSKLLALRPSFYLRYRQPCNKVRSKPGWYQQARPRRIHIRDTQKQHQLALRTQICSASNKMHNSWTFLTSK